MHFSRHRLPGLWQMILAMAATVPVTAHTILGGVVKSVSWADPAKGTKSEIVVKDAARKDHQYFCDVNHHSLGCGCKSDHAG